MSGGEERDPEGRGTVRAAFGVGSGSGLEETARGEGEGARARLKDITVGQSLLHGAQQPPAASGQRHSNGKGSYSKTHKRKSRTIRDLYREKESYVHEAASKHKRKVGGSGEKSLANAGVEPTTLA